MWNRLISIVEEQALTLVRTAFDIGPRPATFGRVFDTEGRMIAQAVTGTPGHVNTMAAAVGHFIDDIGPERIYPGDVYITNDPWKGTGHHDIIVTTPVFRIPATTHRSSASSTTATSSTSGVAVTAPRPVRCTRKACESRSRSGSSEASSTTTRHHGALERTRSDQVIGDIHGLAACNETGRRRLRRCSRSSSSTISTTSRPSRSIAPARPRWPPSPTSPRGPTRTRWWSTATTFHRPGRHPHRHGRRHARRLHRDIADQPLRDHVPLGYGGVFHLRDARRTGAGTAQQLHVRTVHRQRPQRRDPQRRAPDHLGCHVIGHFVTDLTLGAIAHALPEVNPAEGAAL